MISNDSQENNSNTETSADTDSYSDTSYMYITNIDDVVIKSNKNHKLFNCDIFFKAERITEDIANSSDNALPKFSSLRSKTNSIVSVERGGSMSKGLNVTFADSLWNKYKTTAVDKMTEIDQDLDLGNKDETVLIEIDSISDENFSDTRDITDQQKTNIDEHNVYENLMDDNDGEHFQPLDRDFVESRNEVEKVDRTINILSDNNLKLVQEIKEHTVSETSMASVTKTTDMSNFEDVVLRLFPSHLQKSIKQALEEYESTHDVEKLARVLLSCIDRPERVLILREVRACLTPTDLGRFDSLVSFVELEGYRELASHRSAHQHPGQGVRADRSAPLKLGAEGNGYSRAMPPKRTLLQPVPDRRGKYYLLRPEEYRSDLKRLQNILDKFEALGSISTAELGNDSNAASTSKPPTEQARQRLNVNTKSINGVVSEANSMQVHSVPVSSRPNVYEDLDGFQVSPKVEASGYEGMIVVPPLPPPRKPQYEQEDNDFCSTA